MIRSPGSRARPEDLPEYWRREADRLRAQATLLIAEADALRDVADQLEEAFAKGAAAARLAADGSEGSAPSPLAVLREHHNWHLGRTERDEYELIPADEYADSGLCERTVAALSSSSSGVEKSPAQPTG